MMSFKDFNIRYRFKNKATSNLKIYQVLSSIALKNIVIYLRDGPFSSDIGKVNLHPRKGTHWVVYINENFLIVLVVHYLTIYPSLL